MTHQAHAIPWQALADNLKCIPANRLHPGEAANLYPRYKPDQGRKLSYFVKSLIKNIKEHAATERAKYTKQYDIPSRDDVVISDEAAKRLTPTMFHVSETLKHDWNKVDLTRVDKYPKVLCRHEFRDPSCDCPISASQRKMGAFLTPYEGNPCYRFFEFNGEAFFQLEILKALLLYGEMDTVLRISSHPDVDYKKWWCMSKCYDTVSEIPLPPSHVARSKSPSNTLSLSFSFRFFP
jgi:hypothetical protein